MSLSSQGSLHIAIRRHAGDKTYLVGSETEIVSYKMVRELLSRQGTGSLSGNLMFSI